MPQRFYSIFTIMVVLLKIMLVKRQVSLRALLQSHSQEESSPHLARVFQRPRLAHDFTVHVNEAGNRTPNYSSGAPPTPLSRDLPPSCSRESMRCCLTFPLYLSRLGYPLPPPPPQPDINAAWQQKQQQSGSAPHSHFTPLFVSSGPPPAKNWSPHPEKMT